MAIVELFDSKLKINVNSELESWRVSTLLTKEPETIAWISSWEILPSSSFFDIGANIGLFSIFAALQHPNLKVFSFEPEVKNYSALCGNLLLNPKLQVHSARIAFSDTNGFVDLMVDDERVGNSNSQINSANVPPLETRSTVRIDRTLSVSIDEFIEFANIDPPNYLKIDVDGHESQILKGAAKTLSNSRLESMLIEFNSLEESSFWVAELENFGFILDNSFDHILNHSTRRRQKNNAIMRNLIFHRQR